MEDPGLGTAFFCILLKNPTFLYILFSSFWWGGGVREEGCRRWGEGGGVSEEGVREVG